MKTSRWVVSLIMVAALAGMAFAALHGSTVLAQDGTGPGPVVFTSDRSGNYEIYVLDPDTGLMTQLTNDPGNDVDPEWSPDGEMIAFASDRDGDYELYVMRADGSGLQKLTNNESEDRQPRWQPDGQYIVYASDVNSQWDLYLISADGAIVRQLTNDVADERGPGAAQATVVQPVATPIPGVQVTATTASVLPDATVNSSNLNVRANPGEGAQILTTIPGDTPVTIQARYPDNSWVKVLLSDGTVGWVYRPLLTVNINLALVPVENPPFFALPTATPVPATPVPSSQANLVAGIVELSTTPTCQQTFTVGFDVANLGSVATTASGTVSLIDTRTADGSQQGTTIGGFPILQPGETFRVNMPLTINTWYSEQHTITLIIDPSHLIPENNLTDNSASITYTLQKGSCP